MYGFFKHTIIDFKALFLFDIDWGVYEEVMIPTQ